MAGAPSAGGARVDAVLLDMDDTVFDHSLTCREAIRRLRRETPLLRTKSLKELWREYLDLLDGPSSHELRGLRSTELRERRWQLLARSCGAELEVPEVRRLSQTYRAYYQAVRRPVRGAVPLVRQLGRQAKVAIVTNNEVVEQEEKLRFLGLDDVVDEMVVSEAVGRSKPDPAIFEEALARVDTSADRAVMVGDSWTNDVQGARGAGIRPVWFNRFGLPRPGPDATGELRAFPPVRATTDRLLSGFPDLAARPKLR